MALQFQSTANVHTSASTHGTLRDDLLIKNVPSYYTSSQVTQYLTCIGFPTKFTDTEISHGLFTTSLENIKHLVRLHLLAFPFENTSMHYTPDHDMDVTHEGAFRRLVLEHKGSYCYGQNGVFLGMLRGLGYRAYGGAARVNMNIENLGQLKFTTLSHMIIFVQPFQDSNQTYVVDVGFGSPGLVRPILLSDADGNSVMGTTPTERHRLTRRSHPLSTLENLNPHPGSSELNWNLEVWHYKDEGTNAPWKCLYTFNENEYFPADYENASFIITKKPEGIFWNNILCVKHGLEEAKDPNAGAQSGLELEHSVESSKHFMYRIVMRGNEVKRYAGSRSITIRTLTTEVERIHALNEIFGLDIPESAESYIRGRNAALN